MQNNQSDRFEQTKHSFFEKEKSSAQYVEDNFFMAESSQNKISYFVNEQSRRLNDYDFHLLQEDAYKDIQDDLFQLEYKISKKSQNRNKIQINRNKIQISFVDFCLFV